MTLFPFHMIPLFCCLETNIPKERKAAMVSIRFFSFVLVFILVFIGESSAQSQVMETVLAADGSGLEPARKNLPKLGKEAYDAAPAAVEVGNSRLEGRKMMLKWDLDKKTVSVEGSDGEESEKISDADNRSVGKSSHSGKGILNVNCKLRNRNPHRHRHRKAKTAGFTAFSADYHVPKSHPPKNN